MAELWPMYAKDGSNKAHAPRSNDTFINEPDVSFDNISDLTDYKIGQSPRTKSANVMGYYSAGDGGGGTFYWDSSEDKANHNGGTVINPDHNSTIGSDNWYSASGDSTDTSGSGCWVRQRKKSNLTFSHFGAKGDNSNDDSLPLKTALENGVYQSKGGNTYLLGSDIGVGLTEDTTINFNNSKVVKDDSVGTVNGVFRFGGDNSEYDLEVLNVEMDSQSLTDNSELFFRFNNINNLRFCKNKSNTNVSNPFRVFSTNKIIIKDNILNGPDSQGNAIDVRNLSNCHIEGNECNNYTSHVNATATNSDIDTFICNNNKFKTSDDTTIFFRVINNAGTVVRARECIISDNIIYDAGKKAIGVEIPNSSEAYIENVSIVGNVIRGWAAVTSSSGIHVNNVVSSASIINVNCSGNVLRGKLTDGSLGQSNARGHFINSCENVSLNDVVWEAESSGAGITSCDVVNNKSSYYNCNQGNNVDEYGVRYFNCDRVKDSSVINGTQTTSGLYIERCKGYNASGYYSNNAGYGIEEDGDGGTDVRTQNGNINGVTFSNNSSGSIKYTGFNDGSTENGCNDDIGSRHRGTTTRRNNLEFTSVSGASIGFNYFNRTENRLEIWDGDSWVLTDGTSV